MCKNWKRVILTLLQTTINVPGSLIWTAPESDAELVTFITYGNAVNGNGAASGDEWNSNSYAVPGPNYEGEIVTPITEDSISSRQLAVGAIGIIAVLSLTVMAVKD